MIHDYEDRISREEIDLSKCPAAQKALDLLKVHGKEIDWIKYPALKNILDLGNSQDKVLPAPPDPESLQEDAPGTIEFNMLKQQGKLNNE